MLLNSAVSSAVHLEMRDTYAVDEEVEVYGHWRDLGEAPAYDSAFWGGWLPLVEDAVARGVAMRRARIVSEPVTEYIRFEHAITGANLRAGEDVRWLPRPQAVDIALPGSDFWLFDGRIVYFNLFDGDGHAITPAVSEAAGTVALCATAFEAVWTRGIPHDEYKII
ncbi:DUF6879 family protein [Streptomyces sp. DW26H14]|uniref:DUF6879 family protein n=1 Tax=Streptomyces sp. DW26H14 TaxID=3435395 RepID=UPI00403D5D90